MTADADMDSVGGGEQATEQKDLKSEDMDVDAEHEVDETTESKPKKKRRVINTPEKKFACSHPECGKSYSRAEHLYRHRLNRRFN